MQNKWKEVELGDISTIKLGTNSNKGENNFYPEPELVIIAKGFGDIGKVKISPPESLITNSSIVLKLNEDIADKKFYYYYLQTRNLRNITSDSKRPQMMIKNLKKLKVKIPPLIEQQKIVSILSTFDNKIKQNNKMCKALEKAVQAIYERWFMDFEFPDKADKPYKSNGGEFVDNNWGRLPKGWRVGKYTDIIDVVGGATPKMTTKEYWGGDIPLFRPGDFQETPYVSETEKCITKLGLRKSKGNIYPKDTVFVTARGAVGKVNINTKPMAVNESCFALLGKKNVGQYFVYMLTRNCYEELIEKSHGIDFHTIDAETFDSIKIVIPSRTVIQKFQKAVAPLFDEIKKLSLTNNALSKLRDNLLFELTSGEMRVV